MKAKQPEHSVNVTGNERKMKRNGKGGIKGRGYEKEKERSMKGKGTGKGKQMHLRVCRNTGDVPVRLAEFLMPSL